MALPTFLESNPGMDKPTPEAGEVPESPKAEPRTPEQIFREIEKKIAEVNAESLKRFGEHAKPVK